MPELPEVETIKNYIDPLITGKYFTGVELRRKKLRIEINEDFAEKVINAKITKIERKAKYLLLHLQNGLSILMHLGMTGKIIAYPNKTEPEKHDHLIFSLSDGSFLHFNDVRRFGLVIYLKTDEVNESKYLKYLGAEPLTEIFTGEYLFAKAQGKNIEIKKFIMEQKIVVGVGNIYAAESLFMSKIHPQTPSSKITLKKYIFLVANIKKILLKSIEKGGSTIKDYRLVNGESGYFQNEFFTYGLENKPCKICKTAIEKIVQGGRSTFYCPKCQKP